MTKKIILSKTRSQSVNYRKLPLPVARLINELKNPLCNIYLASDALDESRLDEEQRACLKIIMRGSARINNGISTILAMDNKPPEAM